MVKEDDIPEEVDVEKAKLFVDYLKQLTTLSTASILLLVTFLEKLFKIPHLPGLVSLSLGAFLVSILGATLAQTISVASLGRANRPGSYAFGSVGIVLAWGGFVAGIILLTIFAIVNLESGVFLDGSSE